MPDIHAMHNEECSGVVSLDIIRGKARRTSVDAAALRLTAHSTCQARAAVTWLRSATNKHGGDHMKPHETRM